MVGGGDDDLRASVAGGDGEGCHRLRFSFFLVRRRGGQGQVYEDNNWSDRTEGRGGEVVVGAAQGRCKMEAGLVGAKGKIIFHIIRARISNC